MWHKFPGEKTQPDLLRKARFPFQHTMKTVKLKTIQLTAVKTARLDERSCFLTPGGNRRLKDAAASRPAATLRRSRQEAAACYSSLQRGDVIRGLESWNSLSAGGRGCLQQQVTFWPLSAANKRHQASERSCVSVTRFWRWKQHLQAFPIY